MAFRARMITEALKSRLDVSGPLPRAAARILESHVKYEPRYGIRASRTNLALFMDATLRGARTLEYNAREWRKLNRVRDRLLTRAADTATNNSAYGPPRPRVKVTSRTFVPLGSFPIAIVRPRTATETTHIANPDMPNRAN